MYTRTTREPRPEIFLTETDNLQYTEFAEASTSYGTNLGPIVANGNGNVRTVTNLFPTVDSAKFIKLNMEYTAP